MGKYDTIKRGRNMNESKGYSETFNSCKAILGNSIETAILMSVKVRQEIYHRI